MEDGQLNNEEKKYLLIKSRLKYPKMDILYLGLIEIENLIWKLQKLIMEKKIM